MLAITRFFDNFMRSCVRLDDCVFSYYVRVGQGLGQRCVLAPCLFNTFLTAVLQLAVKRSSADEDVIADLVSVKPRKEEPAIWGESKHRTGKGTGEEEP